MNSRHLLLTVVLSLIPILSGCLNDTIANEQADDISQPHYPVADEVAETDKAEIRSLSAEDEVTLMIQETIVKELSRARSDLSFGSVKPSPIGGYYEVSIGNRQTVYVSEDGKHFFSGELYFPEPGGGFLNATEMARATERRAILASVPESELIIYAPDGETKAVMNVFTDVTCGYCRKLHGQIAEMNALGIEVRYFGYPRTGIVRDGKQTKAYKETVKAWCADDKNVAMDRLKSGKNVDVGVCENNPLAKHFELGQQFGVSGTPAIVIPDGTLLPGYRSPENYAAILGIAVE